MKFVPIRTYDNYVPAHIDLGLLKAEGINAWLKDENSVTVNPVLTNAVGGIKLMVAEQQAEQAISILIREQAAYISKLSCPNCRSKNFRAVDIASKPSSKLQALMAFFLGKGILGTDKAYYCSNCKSQFPEPVMSDSSELNIPD